MSKPTTSPVIPRLFPIPPWPMVPFDFYTPTRVVFGRGALARLGSAAQELGCSRALIITDPGLVHVGYPQRAEEFLRDAGLEVFLFDRVEENPTNRDVEAATEFARPLQIDLIVSVGGGSAMDCAKGLNFLLTNGGHMRDYKGFGKAQKAMLPSIGIPTTAGTGSEAQSYALIADDQTHMKMACGDHKASFRVAILDPDLTVTQPAKISTLTGIDALSHAIESYVTTKRNPLSQIFAREAWKLLESNLERVLTNPADLEARGAMQVGAFLAGTAIENSRLGVCHSCANPLTAHYGLTHGLAIGIMLPHVIRFNNHAVPALYADLVEEVGLHNGPATSAADILAMRITHLMELGNVPTTLAALGVSRGIFPVLAEEAAQQWTAKFNPRPVTEADIQSLYEAAL